VGMLYALRFLGAVKMKCYLSGMPELRLGLNDKVMFESTGRSKHHPIRASSFVHIHPTASRGKAIEMEDVKFHQCVRLARFENDRTISFIPPDGEFELMSYRISTPVKPLIWVEAAVESIEVAGWSIWSSVKRSSKDEVRRTMSRSSCRYRMMRTLEVQGEWVELCYQKTLSSN